jgi:hypothetical protein
MSVEELKIIIILSFDFKRTFELEQQLHQK